MSNQFYRFVSGMLIDNFSKHGLRPGDRYYLQIDKDEEINRLVSAFKEDNPVEVFSYKHEFGENYETFSILIGGIKLVIAYTSDNVNPDFLVTLRNLTGDQKNQWEGTALLSIVSTPLDSISGGSSDLQKEGMPLHPQSFVKKLRLDIENEIESKVEQLILNERMDQILEEMIYHQISFFDFEEIFSALSKGNINTNDYKSFGLFNDADLSTFGAKEAKIRLEKNREMFEFVRKYHELGYSEDYLEKKVSSKYTKMLMNENWEDLDFTLIKKAYEEAEKENNEAKIELVEINVSKNLIIWNKPQKETTVAGKRKRHIIIFNPDHLQEIELTANFAIEGNIKRLDAKYISTTSKFNELIKTSAGKANLSILIKTETPDLIFAKVTYKHERTVALGCELLICVVPISASKLKDFDTNYFVDPKANTIISNINFDIKSVGDGVRDECIEITGSGQTITIVEDVRYQLDLKHEAFNEKEEVAIVLFFVEFNVQLPVVFKNEIPETVPITAFRIWKMKREEKQSFQKVVGTSKLIFGNRLFYASSDFVRYLDWEQLWVDNGFKFGEYEAGTIIPKEINISVTLREAYNRFINKFRIKGNTPSLTYLDGTFKTAAIEYIKAYIHEIEGFQEGIAVGSKGIDLFKLGTIHTQDEILFTPFHPINVAYQLELSDSLLDEMIDNAVLTRLRPDSLIPYIYVNTNTEELYKSDIQSDTVEWLTFKPVKKVSISDANKHLAKIVNEKLKQFESHFSYLFRKWSKSPMKINVINIENDLEVVRGILAWIIDKIKKEGLSEVRPIEINIYREDTCESAFDFLSNVQSIEELQNYYNFDTRGMDYYDLTDVMRVIHQSIVFYKKEISSEFEYAHISYYKMSLQEKYAIQSMMDMSTGVALRGLYSVVPSMKGQENFKTGFGVKDYNLSNDQLLVNLSIKVNELAANMKNDGNDSYRKGEAIFSRTTTADEAYLNSIFLASHWVTLLDSNLDLEYFNNLNENIVVIHYNDQYSSSNKYDAITVTNKASQYFEVINEFLKDKDVASTKDTAINTIKAFNTFNGEWLLNIVGSKGHYSREKLSIISAIKFALAYFDHPNIKWVPISLEEVLRIAGNLNKSEGIFTTKNLKIKGSHSDDLLLMGVEIKAGKVIIHFYPVEVKIGVNTKPIMDKAKMQVAKTKKLFKDALFNDEKPFTTEFYRYFFAQLYLSNAAKLNYSGFWPEKKYVIDKSVVEKLNSNEMSISFETESFLGEGAVISFQTNAPLRESILSEGITYINLPESDGYTGLTKSMSDMHYWIQVKENDFIKERMLSYLYTPDNETDIVSNAAYVQSEKEVRRIISPLDMSLVLKPVSVDYNTSNKIEEVAGKDNRIENKSVGTSDVEKIESKTITVFEGEVPETTIEEVRILIGKAENSNKDIYWEYGNKGLANRHLLISGKSGQGKTYFMQCLLLELSKQGIGSIIIDYTEGFLPNQLEPEFVEYLGSNLNQRIVFNERLPINPFRRNIREIGGITLPESDTDIAERIKSVFASVYRSLGIQQLNAIYDAILRGMKIYNEGMNLDSLRVMLEEDGSNYAKTALSQIRPFIDRHVFSPSSSFSWGDVLDSNGRVSIIQLTGYPRDIQLIITEFILWDLWNFTIRFGNKFRPIPVVLDEAQNLDHTEHSPTSKILTEGRKFGWSGWFATQFLKSQLGSDELARLQNSSQKVYFAQPEQEISYIASNLNSDVQERKRLESRILSLKKGQCIVHGPIITEQSELSAQAVFTVNITPINQRI